MGNFTSYMRGMLFSLLAFFVVHLSYAQEKTVTGKVTSPEEGALPGVNVLVKGTTTGTVTDVNGDYRISVPGPESVLVFSSIGYTSEEVTVGNRSTIDLELFLDIQSLSEVVVVGYGTQE
ncbi:MAG: carboxypeptidase-like regulatory domain-containing protein, partial [Cyclobacteriaceae bacterium]